MEAKGKTKVYAALWLLGIAAAFVIILFLTGVFGSGRYDGTAYSAQLLRYEGWKTVRKQEGAFPVELPAYVRPENGNGNTIVNTLPMYLEDGTCLAFLSTNTRVSVTADGEEIYRNVESRTEKPRSMWNYIPLDERYAEARIAIEFSGNDVYDAGILPEVFLGPRAEIQLLAENRQQSASQIAISILFLGTFVLVCAFFLMSDTRFSGAFILLGLFIAALGFSQYLQIVPPQGSVQSLVFRQTFGSGLFFFLPPFYCLYLRIISGPSPDKSYMRFFRAGIICFIALLLLNLAGPAFLQGTLRLAAWLYAALIYCFCLVKAFSGGKESSRRYRVILCASLAAMLAGILPEAFTHLSATVMRQLRPMLLGAAVFAVLQSVSVLLYIVDYSRRQEAIAKELSESRVRLMVNQLKPHYIRNALSTIRTIIRHDPEKAYHLLYDFTKYISYNIDALKDNELIDFSEELMHIREYMTLEQERFGERLAVKYDIGPVNFRVPPLSVQPFAENAVKHGVWPRPEGGTVTISTEETESAYIIRIKDDGVGFDPDNPPEPVLQGHGIGMKNAVYRLEQTVSAKVRIESEPEKGTTITIEIPE